MANIDELDYSDLVETKPATEEAIYAFRAKQAAHAKRMAHVCTCMLCRMTRVLKGEGK